MTHDSYLVYFHNTPEEMQKLATRAIVCISSEVLWKYKSTGYNSLLFGPKVTTATSHFNLVFEAHAELMQHRCHECRWEDGRSAEFTYLFNVIADLIVTCGTIVLQYNQR